MRVLVTAGPTREPIDPVRYIGNRSSGRMGYAIARAAVGRGHAVRLVSGPVALPDQGGVATFRVTTAEEMLSAVLEHVGWCDCLIMAAAVADWRPAAASAGKLKKAAGPPQLFLEPTPDILKTVAGEKGRRIFVGFAAETENVLAGAAAKLASKGLDLIVANDVSQPDAGFDVETNIVTFIGPAGVIKALPLMSKDDVAEEIVEWVEKAGLESGQSAE